MVVVVVVVVGDRTYIWRSHDQGPDQIRSENKNRMFIRIFFLSFHVCDIN